MVLFTAAFVTGCAVMVHREVVLKIHDCIEQQRESYGDLCAEESSGYENMSGNDAHKQGVNCAVESIKICIGWGDEEGND